MGANRPGYFARHHSHTQPQRVASAEVLEEDRGAARLNALHALEDDRENGERSQNSDGGDPSSASEQNPIAMCGNKTVSGLDGIPEYVTFTGHLFSARRVSDSHVATDGAPCKIQGTRVLFPEGYRPRVGHPESWICPVRDCQTIFARCPGSWRAFPCKLRLRLPSTPPFSSLGLTDAQRRVTEHACSTMTLQGQCQSLGNGRWPARSQAGCTL